MAEEGRVGHPADVGDLGLLDVGQQLSGLDGEVGGAHGRLHAVERENPQKVSGERVGILPAEGRSGPGGERGPTHGEVPRVRAQERVADQFDVLAAGDRRRRVFGNVRNAGLPKPGERHVREVGVGHCRKDCGSRI